MRVYAAADREVLATLLSGEAVSLAGVIPDSDDELSEFEAMSEAAASGRVVVAADVDSADQPIRLDQVASFHVDVDGSGDLAWFATLELDQVLALLEG